VKFHWDRDPKKDENSSCWIRVAQMWAGKSWGSVSTPRIGHEVIVDFLEGDPDQPIILGSVHNAVNPPPHTGVVSGLKSNTHKGRGFNQMTMDDTAGKEKITIHGQYDMNTKVIHDQTNTVGGKLTEEIDKDTAITIKTGNLAQKVNTGTASYYVKGAVTQKFDNIWDSKVTGQISIKSNADILIDSDTKITLVTGGSKLVMESGGAISLTGSTITVIGKDAVAVSSAKTDVAGTSEAKFGTGNQTVATNTSKTAVSGAAISSSATGTHEITGAVVKIN
jgi:type VI secretion system secreted protein VgrG